MTATTPETRPDVAAFVAEVRARLADLTDEQREELLDGLEADLSEQLAEGSGDGVDGGTTLPDPVSYAAELRTAAGLPESVRRRRRPRFAAPATGWVGRDLDRPRAWWIAQTERNRWTREAWSLLVVVRPAWWVLRGWIAITLVDQVLGPYEVVTPVPTFFWPPLGGIALVAAIVGSVLLGQGRLRPRSGGRYRTAARVVLLALNILAILIPVTFQLRTFDPSQGASNVNVGYDSGYRSARSDHPTDGLRLSGRPVSNVFAYDAAGVPLEGVQLFDQDGNPLAVQPRFAVSGQRSDRTVGCPWFNGASSLFNVFPLQERTQRRLGCLTTAGADFGDVGEIRAPAPPLAQVPPVTRTP